MRAPSASYSFTVRLQIENRPGMLGRVASVIGEAGGDIGAVDLVETTRERTERDITVKCRDSGHAQRIMSRLKHVAGVRVANISDRTFLMHLGGKIEIRNKIPIRTRDDLSMAYTPGVARVCLAIRDDRERVFSLTVKQNTVAVVTDGTAVLGLGNIGPEAALPVMEGKAVLFKSFSGVDTFPICLNTTDVEKIIEIVKLLEPNFGGVNLEDIAAPNCFVIEERLKKEANIPIFHDDQHGTAIVTVAGLVNALKLVGKKMNEIKVVANGAGAAGIAIIKLLYSYGVRDIIMCDTKGAIYEGRPQGMNAVKTEVAKFTNRDNLKGTLEDVIKGADVFIGVSAEGALTKQMVATMKPSSIIFAMANPNPEIMPDLAKEAGAMVVG